MGFLSGSVTFQRYRVSEDPTGGFGESHLETLKKHVIGKSPGNIYEQPDVGFTGGAHLLDTEFSFEKNIIGEAMHFGVRIDSCQIPSPIKRAWMHQELASFLNDNPSGKPSKAQRTEAKEAVEDRCAQEAEKGNFKKLSEVSVLWDAVSDTIFLGGTSEKTNDTVLGLMERAFGIEVSKVTCGKLATEIADELDLNAGLYSVSPAPFGAEATGNVVWWNGMGDNYDYLGNEFLLWLWWHWETNSNVIALADGSEVSGMFARSLSLDCPEGEHGKDTISSESPVALPEAALAVKMGKLPRKAGLTLVRNELKFDFALQSEMFSVGSAKIGSADESATTSHDLVDRVSNVRELADTVDYLFQVFCETRLGKPWDAELKKIQKWLGSETPSRRQKAA